MAAALPTTHPVAVIGCGHWGKNLVRNMADLGALAAICDPDPALADATARRHGVSARSWAEILADKTIAGVVIAAPAALHAELALAALDAGKHVFVEKPLALSLEDGRRVVARARAVDRVLMVGHLLQYHPAYQAVRAAARAGEIGRIRHIASRRLSFGKLRSEEDALWSFAPHDASMILGLIDEEPSRILCHGSAHVDPRIADIASLSLDFPSGVSARIDVSWLAPAKEQTLTVIGDEGALIFSDSEPWERKVAHVGNAVRRGPRNELATGESRYLAVAQAEPLRRECEHFLSCIASGATPRSDGAEALRVLFVLTAASAAMTGLAPAPAAAMIHETAIVDQPAIVGEGARIWHFSHVLKNSRIGPRTVVGQNCVLGPDVSVGADCKIQNNVSVYKGVTLEDGVFCGPSCVFTNVMNPRAEIERKSEFRPTLVKRGATIGANATIVCGVTLGRYSFVGAGAVVTKDVPDFALVVGAPARRIGWMSRDGHRLSDDLVCPGTGRRYRAVAGDRIEEIP